MHYIDSLKAVEHMLKDVRVRARIYTWFRLHRNTRGRRTMSTIDTGMLYETCCNEMIQKGQGKASPIIGLFGGDGSVAGKSKVCDMVYVTAACLHDDLRRQAQWWVLCAVLPHLNEKEASKHRPAEGWDSTGYRKTELAQQCWQPILGPWISAMLASLVMLWNIGGVIMRVMAFIGGIIGDLPQHWMFLGEAHKTCLWCRCPKGQLGKYGKWPLKFAHEQSRRIVEAMKGNYPGWNKW